MRPIDIELWVQRVAEQAGAGQHTEDSLVELKAQWPQPADAARRIAAHANAARGAPILWIIGIDELRGVTGAEPSELADWYASVCSQFDQVYPEPQDLNVKLGERTVVALLFSTDRAPYVVRNAAFGSKGGGSVQWEVPWREGRKTRSARRHDLLRLLGPLTSVPEIECLGCQLRICREWTDQASQVSRWYVSGSLYVVPQSPSVVVFPFHRCTLTVAFGGAQTLGEWERLLLSTPSSGGRIESTTSEILVAGPGTINFLTSRVDAGFAEDLPQEVTCTLKMPAIGSPLSTTWSGTLVAVEPGLDSCAKWELQI